MVSCPWIPIPCNSDRSIRLFLISMFALAFDILSLAFSLFVSYPITPSHLQYPPFFFRYFVAPSIFTLALLFSSFIQLRTLSFVWQLVSLFFVNRCIPPTSSHAFFFFFFSVTTLVLFPLISCSFSFSFCFRFFIHSKKRKTSPHISFYKK